MQVNSDHLARFFSVLRIFLTLILAVYDMNYRLKYFIRKVKKSEDSKVLLSNFSFLMLLQIAGYVFPLITIPYLAQVIGVDGFGKIAFATAVMGWFQTVSDWGFNYTATRDVARNKGDPEKISEIFSNVLWAKIFLAGVSFAILSVLVSTVPYFTENKGILFITFLLVPGHIMFPDWFFQAMERMKYITFFNLAAKGLFTVLVFVFINDREDYILQPLLTSFGYLLSGISAMYIIIIKWGVRIQAPSFLKSYSAIKNSTDVFINNIMPNLYNSFSIVLLGFVGGSSANGIFEAGSKFVNITQQFMNIIARVFFPFLSRKIDRHDLYAKGSIVISLIGAIILYVLAPKIIPIFYTPEFNDAISILRIMAFSLVFLTFSSVYGTNYLILKGKERKLRNITFVCSFIGFALSFPLIYMYGFMGAAINIFSVRLILGLAIFKTSISKDTLD